MMTPRDHRNRPALLGGAIVAAIVVVVGFAVSLREVAATFLVAYVATLGVVLGVLAMALIANITTATWFRPFRARAESVIDTLPVLAFVGFGVLLCLPVVYPWVGSGGERSAYLNTPFFIIRWVIYWATWLLTAASLKRGWRAAERGQIEEAHHRLRRTACVGLCAMAITMTFAAFDWMMSLTPDWLSTIYGVYWFAGGLVGALALLALMVGYAPAGVEWPAVSDDELHSLGKLLLTFVLFWLYCGFSQYIVIWSGDLPNEVTWYIPRTHGGWGAIAALLVLGGFAIPFLLLLFVSVKRSRRALGMVAGLLLALHYVDMFWVVMPGASIVRWWTVVVAIAVLALVVMALVTLRRGRDWRTGQWRSRQATDGLDYGRTS